jgi:uncharacterized protein YndB with AHSA1/START domain
VAEEHAALRFTRRYSASLDEVWRALTDPGSVSRWLGLPEDVETRMRTVESGRVLELDWARRGESDSLVRFELAPDDEGTVLVVDHSRLDARVCMAYFGFWAPRLDRFGEAVGGERR